MAWAFYKPISKYVSWPWMAPSFFYSPLLLVSAIQFSLAGQTQEIFLSLPEIKLMAFPLGSPNVFPLGISEHTFMPVGIPCYSALDCPDSVTHFEDHQCLSKGRKI